MIRNLLLYICSIALFFVMGICNGQEVDKDKLLSYIGTGNAGTEFWVTFPPCYEEVTGSDNNCRLFVVSPISQPVTIEVPGKAFSVTKMARVNDVIEFKLPSAIAQPYWKYSLSKAPAEKIYINCGVHITALTPIIVYGMTRFQYTSDGFLAVPVSKLGTDYIIASWPQYTAIGSSYKLPAVSNIVAARDNTKVTFTMGGTGGSKTTGGLKPGKSSTWNLNEGDVLCFANDDDNQDIAGSRVVSDKPIGIVSGNQCANVPAGVPWCDFIDEMEMPITTWGKEYHVIPIAGRLNNPIIRIFAHPDYKNVKIFRDGKAWLTLPNNNRTLNQSCVETRVYDGPPRAAVITADAPIYIMLYNPGQSEDNAPYDPFQMVIVPVEQYQKEVAFSPPNVRNGTLPFDTNYISLMYCLDDKNAIPDDLEFAEADKGIFEWKKVSERFGKDIGQRFEVKTLLGKQYAVKHFSLPQNGVFKIRAREAFTANIYGKSKYDGYGYPVSADLKDLSVIDTIPPTITVKSNEPTSWRGIMEDYIVKRVYKVPNKDSNDVKGYIASAFLAYDYSYNVDLSYPSNELSLSKKPIEWGVYVMDKTRDARAVFVVTDMNYNMSYKDLVYKSPDTNTLILYPPEKITLNITNDSVAKAHVVLKNLNKVLPIYVGNYEITGKEFSIEGATLQNRSLQPEEEIKIPVLFKTIGVGNYQGEICFRRDYNRKWCVKVNATAVKSGIELMGKIYFDSSFVGKEYIQQPGFGIKAKTGEFYDTAYITRIEADYPNVIGFMESEFGLQGFQIDTSLFMNKKLIPGKTEIYIPVKFKPRHSGIHYALLLIFVGKEFTVQQFIGYGKVATSATDDEQQKCNIFVNITQKELIVQSVAVNKESKFFIYNQLGENILSGTIPAGSEHYTMPIYSLSAGMYIFSTEVNGKRVQEKFVVMR